MTRIMRYKWDKALGETKPIIFSNKLTNTAFSGENTAPSFNRLGKRVFIPLMGVRTSLESPFGSLV